MLKLDIGCSKNIIIYFLKKERVQQPGPASSEVECPLFNPGFQVWFLHQRADGTSFAQWQLKCATWTSQISLAANNEDYAIYWYEKEMDFHYPLRKRDKVAHTNWPYDALYLVMDAMKSFNLIPNCTINSTLQNQLYNLMS